MREVDERRWDVAGRIDVQPERGERVRLVDLLERERALAVAQQLEDDVDRGTVRARPRGVESATCGGSPQEDCYGAR